jgi:hypothetical protein
MFMFPLDLMPVILSLASVFLKVYLAGGLVCDIKLILYSAVIV